MNYRNIVILTGAGLSAESGLGTFRDKRGLWSQFDIAEVATPEGFARNPAKVQDFHNLRRRLHGEAKPNTAHVALARLEREGDAAVLVVTQNIDALHEAAGTKKSDSHAWPPHALPLCGLRAERRLLRRPLCREHLRRLRARRPDAAGRHLVRRDAPGRGPHL